MDDKTFFQCMFALIGFLFILLFGLLVAEATFRAGQTTGVIAGIALSTCETDAQCERAASVQ